MSHTTSLHDSVKLITIRTNTRIPPKFEVTYIRVGKARGIGQPRHYAVVGSTMPRSLAMTPTR